jgi:hypothetical protein
MAISYVKQHLDLVAKTSWLACSPDDELVSKALCVENVDTMSANPNELATDYCLAHMPPRVPAGLSKNPNPKAVSFMLQHPHGISADFYSIDDERIVDHILTLPQGFWALAGGNPNERVVKHYIAHTDDISGLSGNPCQLAVDYIIKEHPSLIYYPLAVCNPNETMARYVIGNGEPLPRQPIAQPGDIDRYGYACAGSKSTLVIEWVCKHLDRIRIGELLENPLMFVRDMEHEKFMSEF